MKNIIENEKHNRNLKNIFWACFLSIIILFNSDKPEPIKKLANITSAKKTFSLKGAKEEASNEDGIQFSLIQHMNFWLLKIIIIYRNFLEILELNYFNWWMNFFTICIG